MPQQAQRHQRAQYGNTPACRQQRACCNQSNDAQVGAEPGTHRQQGARQHQHALQGRCQSPALRPHAQQQGRGPQYRHHIQPARQPEQPAQAVHLITIAPQAAAEQFRKRHAIAAESHAAQQPDDGRIHKHCPAGLRPPRPRLGQTRRFATQPEQPQQRNTHGAQPHGQQPDHPALQHHQQAIHRSHPTQAHDGLYPARSGQPSAHHLQNSRQGTQHQQVLAGFQMIYAQVNQQQDTAQHPQHQRCAADKSMLCRAQ